MDCVVVKIPLITYIDRFDFNLPTDYHATENNFRNSFSNIASSHCYVGEQFHVDSISIKHKLLRNAPFFSRKTNVKCMPIDIVADFITETRSHNRMWLDFATLFLSFTFLNKKKSSTSICDEYTALTPNDGFNINNKYIVL